MDQPINDNQNHSSNRIPYDGEPLQDSEVLVPQFINREYADLIEAKGVRTWYRSGVPYHIMYVPVPADQVGVSLKAFNADVNDYLNEQLGPNRYSRCLIKMPDGSKKPCPKEINGSYNPCTNCPHRGQLEKEDRSFVSMDALDEQDFHPANATPSAEDCAMLSCLLTDLLDDFAEQYPHYAEIIRLGYQGYDRKEIVEMLPVKKTQAYQTIKNCRKYVRDSLIT